MGRFDLIQMTTWASSVLSQTCPCGHLYYIKPAHVVTCIKANLPMLSPLLHQTSPCGHLYSVKPVHVM
jgi:hypothetical protein